MSDLRMDCLDVNLNNWLKKNIPFLDDEDLIEDYPIETIKKAYNDGVACGIIKCLGAISQLKFNGKLNSEDVKEILIFKMKAELGLYE